jgi:hypothetical protein
MFEGNERMWYSFVDIVILTKDSNKCNLEEQREVENYRLELCKSQIKKPIQANWEKSEDLALINMKKVKHKSKYFKF